MPTSASPLTYLRIWKRTPPPTLYTSKKSVWAGKGAREALDSALFETVGQA